jgi:hypothetical protein
MNVDTTSYGYEVGGSYYFFLLSTGHCRRHACSFRYDQIPKALAGVVNVHSSYTRLFEGGIYKPPPSSSDYVTDTRVEDADLQ